MHGTYKYKKNDLVNEVKFKYSRVANEELLLSKIRQVQK